HVPAVGVGAAVLRDVQRFVALQTDLGPVKQGVGQQGLPGQAGEGGHARRVVQGGVFALVAPVAHVVPALPVVHGEAGDLVAGVQLVGELEAAPAEQG